MSLALASRLYWRRFLRRNAIPWDDLERFPALDAGEQRRELAARLLAQIRYFGARDDALAEWKDAARITDPGELWRIWGDLPVMTKPMLRERFPAEELRRRFAIEGQVRATGGSTGEPTRFVHDTAMSRASLAGNTFTRIRMGWRPGMATVIVWGSERDIGRQSGDWKSRAMARLLREHLVDGYELTGATVDRALALIRANAPCAMYGFTTMLDYIAREALSRGERPPAGRLRTAWTGGEMLLPEQSERFEQAFGVPLLDRYGGRELSTIACQYERGGPLCVLRPWVFLEVLREDGKPAPAGETGRIVLTSTVCRGTPFLRYDIEDLGVFHAGHCQEAGITALEHLEGRRAGLARLPGGAVINNLYWNHLFKEFPEVRQFQVVYRRDRGIALTLAGDGMSEGRETQLRSMISHLLPDASVGITWTDRIPRTREGKLIQVIQEREPPR